MFGHYFYYVGLLILIYTQSVSHAAPVQPNALQQSTSPKLGFKLGSIGQIHIYFSLYTQADSNPSYQALNNVQNTDLTIQGRLGAVFNISRPKIDFKLAGRFDWNQYIGIANSKNRTLSGYQINTDTGIKISNESKSINFTVFNNFNRFLGPPNPVLLKRLNYISNISQMEFNYSPQQKTMSGKLLYSIALNWFEPDQTNYAASLALSNLTHHLNFGFQWRFLPRTMIDTNLDLGMVTYPYQATNVENFKSYPLRVRAGLSGQVSQKITLQALIGYGNSLSIDSKNKLIPNTHAFLVSVLANWKIFEFMQFQLEYTRDFAASNFYARQSFDRVGLLHQWAFLRRFQTNLKLQYEYQVFQIAPGSLMAAISPTIQDRKDHIVQIDFKISTKITTWASLIVYYMPEIRFSNAFYFTNTGEKKSAGYIRHIGGLSVNLNY